jgi:hypothetical protein
VAGQAGALPRTDGSTDVANGATATCELAGQPLRGVVVRLADVLRPASATGGTTITLTVRSATGTLRSGRFTATALAAGTAVRIPLAGESLHRIGRLQVSVGVSGAAAPMRLAAVGGRLACAPVTPTHDGLALAYADPTTIVYRRLTALPRIRWAGSATVITNRAGRVSALTAGVPRDTVVLSKPGPAGSGASAAIVVRSDRGGNISARVGAPGPGYLVVADAMQQPGWSVTVDGKHAALVDADHAMAAVLVPAGEHDVTFHYAPPGQRVGAAVSVLTALAMLAVFGWDRRRQRREPTTVPTVVAQAEPEPSPVVP